jgi:hypothetical protein
MFNFDKREWLMLAITLSVTAFGIAMYIAAGNPGGPLSKHGGFGLAQERAYYPPRH